ncbi:MAG: response regulator [Candidatus Nitrosotenuis sp.]|nr:response regulator [Candidatus Nitrosotenuis sp.]
MGRNILVAEDSPSYALLYKQIFESRGHTVTVTDDGEECIASYKNMTANSDARQFDMVILDYSMPKKNGLETAKEILQIRPDQRILFISSFGDELTPKLRALSNGTNIDVLEKPFNSQSLIQKVEFEIEGQVQTGLVPQ